VLKSASKPNVTALPRTVGLANEPPRRETALPAAASLPIEWPSEPPAPEELSVDAQLGGMKVRAGARSPLAIVAVVLIVLIIVVGKVLIARTGGTSREELRREELGRCTERIQRTELIERPYARDGS
jgi:hypothetical protein